MASIRNKKDRLANFYKIVNDKAKLVTFRRNEAQVILREKKAEIRKKKGRLRLCILKGRQLWITTDWAIDWLDDAIMKENQNFIIIAQDRETQKKIFTKVKLWYLHTPNSVRYDAWTKIRKKPQPSYDNVNELYFPRRNNKISVALHVRWTTATGMHITELAFRKDMKKVLTSSIPAAPDDCDIVIETTANGTGTPFYTFRNKHHNDPNSEFDTLFLWRRLKPTYRRKLYKGEVIKLPKELEYLNNLRDVKLDDEQKKRYMAMYSAMWEEVFQEYPCTPEEAFLASWSSVFNINQIKNLPEVAYTSDDLFPELRLYAEPTQEYVIAVDTSEWSEDGDFTSISCRDINWSLLACYYGKIPTDVICDVLDRMWYLGYEARVYGIERNNTWLATIKVARERYNNNTWCERYDRMYEEEVYDKKRESTTTKIWRYTGTKTRPIMVTEYLTAVRKEDLNEFDARCVSEMHSFIRWNTRWGARKAQADQGAHDDAIIADMICLQMMKQEYLEWSTYGRRV